MSVDESGTLSINLDGTTITLDEAKNVIKLADTLKDKINGAFPAANLINNLTTTEAGFGLDARQGKVLDDKITEINGSLNVFFVDLNSEISLENVYNKYAQQHYAMYIGNINYNNKLAYNANTTYVFISNWGMVALVLNESKVIHYDTATKTWKY